jgi:thiamine biosynthesis protein ThiC
MVYPLKTIKKDIKLINYKFMKKMSQLQLVFDRIQKSKKEVKEIKAMYNDALNNSQEYQKILEQQKVLKINKKVIESKLKSDFESELDKFDVLKNEIKSDSQLLSDISVAMVAKGEIIEVKDEFDTVNVPVFKVNFTKSN